MTNIHTSVVMEGKAELYNRTMLKHNDKELTNIDALYDQK